MPAPTHRSHLWLFFGYPLVGLLFLACEHWVPEVVHLMEWTVVDRAIPLVPWMVVPYVLWYLTIFFTFAWTGWRAPGEFVRFVAYICLATATACLFYLLYPNGQRLRPATEALGSGWDAQILGWIYAHDTPTNSNPSIHVIDAIGVWIALGRDRTLRRLPGFLVALALVSLAIIASTVLVKQHSILDVFGGLLWAGFWATIVYSKGSWFFRFGRR